jgi:hypothetical protein
MPRHVHNAVSLDTPIFVVLVTQDHGAGFTYAENFLYVHDACPLLMPLCLQMPDVVITKGCLTHSQRLRHQAILHRMVAASISSTSLTPAMRQQTPRVGEKISLTGTSRAGEQKLVSGKWHVKRASMCAACSCFLP